MKNIKYLTYDFPNGDSGYSELTPSMDVEISLISLDGGEMQTATITEPERSEFEKHKKQVINQQKKLTDKIKRGE